jgi:murein DD-endopeptidase MepM/ murein hydrolase activator NlpD
MLCHTSLAAGQDTLSQVGLRSRPSPLPEGTIGWLLVQPHGRTVTGGEAAGEPIHFERTPEGEYRGLVAVPLDTSDSLPVLIVLSDDGQADTVVSSVSVAAAGYARETIMVAPAFAKPNPEAAARIRRENARSREVSRASRTRPRVWDGPFRLPRDSRVTSGFGSARIYNGEVKSRHTGTDFAGGVGAPVVAAGRGVVAMVADFYLAGQAAYFHLSRADVVEGDTVTAGQKIGGVGRSGRVTGPHLHWVARYGTISVDPMSLLELVRGER